MTRALAARALARAPSLEGVTCTSRQYATGGMSTATSVFRQTSASITRY
jgi:hypothetical protein